MKKNISILLSLLLIVSLLFSACSSKDDKKDNEENSSGILSSDDQYGLEIDENGNQVLVKYEKDKDGNIIANVVDEDGKNTGVTVPAKNYDTNKNNTDKIENNTKPDKEEDITNKTEDEKQTTSPELTTLPFEKDKVPNTSDTGDAVRFSDKDVARVAKMLEVPYLYTANYENVNGVPISLARHVACWMAQNNGITTTTFAGDAIIIDLFTFFAETVTNFKTECNDIKEDSTPAKIKYNPADNIFTISSYETKTHSVRIDKIEDLGNNNYYKVYGSVSAENKSGCKSKKVVAVIQKNKLNTKLGFSIKALKWS